MDSEEDVDEGSDNMVMDAMFGESESKNQIVENSSITGYLCTGDVTTKKKQDYCNDKILFRDFCLLMEKIMKSRDGTKVKVGYLFSFLKKSTLGPDQSLYPFLRLVLPVNDVERGKIGLKQSSLARTYINALHLDKKTSTAAMQLIFFKDPAKRNIAISTAAASGTAFSENAVLGGDFSDVLEGVLKERVQTEFSTATLRDIHGILDSLANAANEKAQTAIIRDRVITRFNATEQKWLARIIYRDLKIGLSVETIFKYFYPSALSRYNETGSIKQVCEEEGMELQAAGEETVPGSGAVSGLQVFTKFNPMLAKGFNKDVKTGVQQVAAVEAAMLGQPFVMDVKLDGERICAHVGRKLTSSSSSSESREVMLITRSGTDYTDNYRQLAEAVKDNVLVGHDVILDGEVLAWDSVEQKHIPFGNNSMVAKAERERASRGTGDMGPPLTKWMKFVVFDLLYFAGPKSDAIIKSTLRDLHMLPQSDGFTQSQTQSQNLNALSLDAYAAAAASRSGDITKLPLIVRRSLLQRVLGIVPGRIEPVQSRHVTTVGPDKKLERQAALEDYFNDLVAAGEEGLVVKLLGSEYLLGEKSRAAGYWVKMKPEYGDQTADLDLAILGGYYGESGGERGQGVAKFLCGVRDDKNPNLFYTLAKVGTGYSVSELRELRQRLQPAILPTKETDTEFPHLPNWIISRKSQFRPDVFYDPHKSVVLQFKCGGIVDSLVYSSGLALRFPRVERIRYDKPCEEVLTKSEVYNLKENFRKSSTSGPIEGQEEGREGKGKKRPAAKKQPKIANVRLQGVDEQFHLPLPGKQQSGAQQLFADLVFCVFDCDFTFGKRLKVAEFPQLSSLSTTPSVLTSPGVDDLPRASNFIEEKVRVYTRKELIEMIRFEGGTVEASATSPACRVVASSVGKRSLQLTHLIQEQSRDVIDFTYILDCLAAGRLLPLKNTYFLSRNKCPADVSGHGSRSSTAGGNHLSCDIFGLGFDEEVTAAELERLFGVMEDSVTAIQKRCVAAAKSKAALNKKSTSVKRQKMTGYDEDDEQFQNAAANIQDLEKKGWREIIVDHILPCIEEDVTSGNTLPVDSLDMVFRPVNLLWDKKVYYIDKNNMFGTSGTEEILNRRMLLYGARLTEEFDDTVTDVAVHGHGSTKKSYNNATCIDVNELEKLLSREGEQSENYDDIIT